jgi:hypothetical protein
MQWFSWGEGEKEEKEKRRRKRKTKRKRKKRRKKRELKRCYGQLLYLHTEHSYCLLLSLASLFLSGKPVLPTPSSGNSSRANLIASYSINEQKVKLSNCHFLLSDHNDHYMTPRQTGVTGKTIRSTNQRNSSSPCCSHHES